MHGGISILDWASVAEILHMMNAVQGFLLVDVVSNYFLEDTEAPSRAETPCMNM